MHFTTTKEKILNAILVAERVVGKKESLPVLSCILLDVGRELSVRSTNLEAGVDMAVLGDVTEKGIIAVPASILSQTLRSVSGDKVTLRTEGANLLIESRGSKTLIKAIPHDEFPTIAAAGKDGARKLDISRTTLMQSLQSVAYAASTSMIRPELGSVYLSVKDGALVAVATDSFRLAEKTASNASGKGSDEVLIPLKHVQEIIHIIEKLSSENISLSIDDSQLLIVADSLRFVSRVVDGNFPNYKEIIPKSFSTEATLLKGDFAEALRKARVFSGADQHVGFHVYPKKKVFDITAQSAAIGEMSDSLEAAITGEDIDVNFHIGYIADCLQSIQSDSIILGFAGVGKPVVIRGVSDSTFTYLAMPLNR
ncbi:DNA polymerase III subunit beta [Candidatus Kaiserbacteria bacterium RIFCSPHIGHO2_01_FULL_56_24]|uniref:Beta sliding clamp n=1 Tax=Candidatus Kaiserbacteria bacterium RIFCSPHIGHO2_01_FULL_56_24 TaxID=1798487 RepID=A0A1F6DAW1_9BACT|nr:MAG: DNA polymerase III subunit beta [Candidatus Kaiserbacteria bacterium RIFCSPHIGHO2_01_FULL_56_24]